MSRRSGIRFLAVLLFVGSSAASAEPVCARATVNLRQARGTQSKVSWKVPKYMPFLRLQTSGGWSKLQDFEGEVHWARNSEVTSQFRCVVVKSNVAALHKEPSANSPGADLKTLDRYTPLKRLKDLSPGWLFVEDPAGHQAWIQDSQVWKPVTISSFKF